MAFEIKITATTADELVSAIDAFHAAIAGRAPSVAAETTQVEDAPKATRRRTAAKTTGETESGAASESAQIERPALIADEGNAEAPSESASPTGSVETSVSTAQSAEPTQEDKDALLKEATEFSQKHGHDALLGALKAVGAERFSAIPFSAYGEFRAAMAAHGIGASALS